MFVSFDLNHGIDGMLTNLDDLSSTIPIASTNPTRSPMSIPSRTTPSHVPSHTIYARFNNKSCITNSIINGVPNNYSTSHNYTNSKVMTCK